jgi:hypothetical protein
MTPPCQRTPLYWLGNPINSPARRSRQTPHARCRYGRNLYGGFSVKGILTWHPRWQANVDGNQYAQILTRGVSARGRKQTEGSLPLRARTRAAPLYSVGPMRGPDHEAIIRFGGKAPRRRAHSNERFDDHVPARVTTTSARHRSARQGSFRAGRSETLCACAHCLRGAYAACRSTTPCGTSPVVTMRQSAMSSLRASATIIFVLRAPLAPSVSVRNH